MTSSSQNPMDALNALMEERNRYEQWLVQLDARKGTTPPHVFERVRGDYGARLQNVLDQLAGRATELQETATTLADQVAALYADETRLRDERAEAELRASVGEFALDHAREVMQRCDDAIASLGTQRASVGAELGRVQEILAVAVRAPTPPSGEAPIVPIESLAPAAPPPPLTAPSAATPATPQPSIAPSHGQPAAEPTAPPASFDELAFLQSVVDRPDVPAGSVLAEQHSPSSESSHAEPSAPAPQPAVTRSPIDFGADAVVASNGTQPRRAAAPTPVLTSTPLVSKDGHEPNPSLTPGSIPAFLKDVPTEQIKTLKCQECGTMNYPTEWYCERCGGELAAM